jgi:hypothetical protein
MTAAAILATSRGKRRRQRTPEGDVKRAIVDGCKLRGWPLLRFNSGGARVPGAGGRMRVMRFSFDGCPDLAILRADGKTLWVEVKAPGGKLRPAQAAFRDLCARHGVPWVEARAWEDVEKAMEATA